MARSGTQKPKWVIEREKSRREGTDTVWLFGLHAVRDALLNPTRTRHRLIVTPNARDRLSDAIETAGIAPDIADPRKFPAPLDPGSVHQGAALEADPLAWGSVQQLCEDAAEDTVVVLLDRVTDPHNVGAILRTAEVFGARAVVAPRHHAAPETGALAKAASGALERQPYLRVRNLGEAMKTLQAAAFTLIGLDQDGEQTLSVAVRDAPGPVALVLGAEGAGLRMKTRDYCTTMARIESASGFGSLNVSNAAAVALYLTSTRRKSI